MLDGKRLTQLSEGLGRNYPVDGLLLVRKEIDDTSNTSKLKL